VKVTVKLARGDESTETTVETPNGLIPGVQSMQLVLCLLGWHGWKFVSWDYAETETKGYETT